MALSIDWGTKVITIPKSDLSLVQANPTEILQLDLNSFRLELRDFEAQFYGITYLSTHNHVPPISVGGVTLARVVEIINGYTVTFEDGAYAVNLIGANSNVGDVVNVNQVSVRSSNSAGLTFSDAINKQSYLGGAVWINTISGLTGTTFPRGTPTNTVNNFQDAQIIADINNLSAYSVLGSIPFLVTADISETDWGGFSTSQSSLTFNSNNTSITKFELFDLFGTMNGETYLFECNLNSLSNFSGVAKECRLSGRTTIDPSFTGKIIFENCYSNVPGQDKAILDLLDSSASAQIRGYHGGLKIENLNTNQNVSVDIDVGPLEIDSTCTNGTIRASGRGTLIDNSGPGCTVISGGWLDPAQISSEVPTKRPGFRL